MYKFQNYVLITMVLFFMSTSYAQYTFNNANSLPGLPNGKTWKIVDELTDDFNTGNKLNATKWDDFHPNWKGRPPSAFKKGNAFQENGFLKLRSTLLRNPNTVNDKFKDIWVNSAACVSKGKTAKPGYYYEMRMKASSLSMTSSFWFRVGNFSEIDVIEHIGAPSNPKKAASLPFQFHTNTHYYGPQQGPEPKGSEWVMPKRGRDTFHNFGFWWKNPKELLFYYNGRQVMRLVPRVPLNENLKMIFDTEVFPFATAGVANIGLPLPKNLNDNSKNTMLVDWVRVYKIGNGPAPTPAPTTPPSSSQLIKNGLYSIKSVKSNQRILARALDNHNARMHDLANFRDQQWLFSHLGNNVYTIKNLGTQRYLEAPSQGCSNGTNISTWTNANGNHKKWKAVKNGDAFSFLPMHCQQRALDVSGGKIDGNLQLWSHTSKNGNQKWKLLGITAAKTSIEPANVVAYPNPTSDLVTVSGLSQGDIITIHNLLGKQLDQFAATATSTRVALSKYGRGMIFLRVNNETLKIVRK